MKEEDTLKEQKKLMFKKEGIKILFFFSLASCQVLKPNTYLLKTNQEKASKYSKYIKAAELKKHLTILASDDFEGRETTTKGQKKAANYIKDHFFNNHISPAIDSSYFQEFTVDVFDFSNVELIVNDTKLLFLKHYYSFGNPITTQVNKAFAIEAGYGISNKFQNDYNNLNATDRIVVLKRGIPDQKNYKASDGNWRKKVRLAKKEGAVAVIFKEPNYSNTDLRIKEYIRNPIMKMHGNQASKPHIPVFIVDEKIVDSLLKPNTTISFSTKIKQPKTAENVIGYIPGKTDEIIVLSAHYDHIGYDNGEICNGADDDGSGTSALLEISKSFQKAFNNGIKPQRALLFLAVSGEEKGLFGSKFYTENPIFPLSKTTTNLNIDMVGRKDTIHKNSNYIYLIGSNRISKELHKISEQINNQHIQFNLDYTYNDQNDPNRFYERSDHYNFAKNGIPVIFYFGGLHEDYHQPSDDVDKIDFNKLEKVSQYVFLTAWELAYRKKAVKK